MKPVVEELRKCGLSVKDWEKHIETFVLTYVTEKLFQIMREGEGDGIGIKENTELKFFEKIVEFMDLVGGKKKYDIKSRPDWKLEWYYFDGYVLRFDDSGNIVFGIILKATFSDLLWGYNDWFGHGGAGAAQILDNIVKPQIDNVVNPFKNAKHFAFNTKKYIAYLKDDIEDSRKYHYEPPSYFKRYYKPYEEYQTVNWEVLTQLKTFFDDPRDYDAIELGYEYYNNQRYKK